MATTDANGIVFYEETDAVSPLHTLLNLGQQSISDVVGSHFISATSAPTAVAFKFWYNPTTQYLYVSDGSAWYYVAGGTRSWLTNGVDNAGISSGTTTTIMTNTITGAPAGTYLVLASINAYSASVIAGTAAINVAGTDVYTPRHDMSTTGIVQTHAHTFTHAGGNLTVAVKYTPSGGTGLIRGSGTRMTIVAL